MENEQFVRTFNRRRIFSKVSTGLLGLLLVLNYLRIGLWVPSESHAIYIGIIGLYFFLNWLMGKCPACKRFIGVAGFFKGLPRGAPCKFETHNIERLDWPD